MRAIGILNTERYLHAKGYKAYIMHEMKSYRITSFSVKRVLVYRRTH